MNNRRKPFGHELAAGRSLAPLISEHPGECLFYRVNGSGLALAGITHGDILVVDRKGVAEKNDIVAVVEDGLVSFHRWDAPEVVSLTDPTQRMMLSPPVVLLGVVICHIHLLNRIH